VVGCFICRGLLDGWNSTHSSIHTKEAEMNTHKLSNWLVVLTLLLPALMIGKPVPVQAVSESLHTLGISETTDLAGPQTPTARSTVKVSPPGRMSNVTTAITFDPSDDLIDFEGSAWALNAGDLNSDGEKVNDGGISLQERYEADVKTAQLNEARRLTAPASDLTSFDKTRRITAEPDSDDDGMPDAWESANGLNPNDPSDAWIDSDSDYVMNLFEYQLSSGPNNASTPAVVTVSASENVEAAIGSATTGQVVRVEGGTYDITYMTFSPKTIMIQGGWNSDFTRRDLGATPTIFDGHSLGEVLYFSFSSGANSVILDGLTLTNGEGFFGALNMIAKDTSVMKWSIMNCTIANSESTSTFGAAAHIIHWDDSKSDVFVINSIVANNSSSGICNSATENAEGRWKIINSDITNNQSTDADEGYGIDAFTLDDGVLTSKLKNTILWGNQKTALEVSGFGYTTTVEAEYSDVGTVNVSYGATYNPGAGMIDSDPLFVAPGNGDFTLQEGSPCIDVGSNTNVPSTDFDGDPRPLDGDLDGTAVVDIGADEFRPCQIYLPLMLKDVGL
jgi:hypothetical protein